MYDQFLQAFIITKHTKAASFSFYMDMNGFYHQGGDNKEGYFRIDWEHPVVKVMTCSPYIIALEKRGGDGENSLHQIEIRNIFNPGRAFQVISADNRQLIQSCVSLNLQAQRGKLDDFYLVTTAKAAG